MGQLRILGLYVLLLAAAIYAGIKAYIHFTVQGELDALSTRVRPFASITYGGISSALEGRLVVADVAIRVPGRPLPVRVSRVQLEGPGPGFLFDAAAGFRKRRIPPWMRISLQGAELPDVHDWVPADPSTLALRRADPCSLSGLLQQVGSWQNERSPLKLDLSLEYHIDLEAGSGRAGLEYQTEEGDSLGIEVALTRLSPPGMMMGGALPDIERIGILLQPAPQRVRSLVLACADQAHLSTGAFVDSLLSRPAPELAADLGFLPGPGLRDALHRVLTNPRELSLNLGPVDNLLQLQTTAANLSPEQLIRRLGLELSVNGEAVEDLSFRIPDSVDIPHTGTIATEDTSAGAPRQRQRPRMVDTPVAQLDNYLGRDVRIYISGRERPHSGILSRVQEERVSVEQRVFSGTMTVHLPVKDIVRVQVMRFAPEP